jgi:hypothetical protein
MSKDNIYFNATILPTDPIVLQSGGQAKFDITRTDNILDKAGDYEVSVVRFSIPTSNIPLSFTEDALSFKLESQSAITISTLTLSPNTVNPLYGQPAIYNYSQVTRELNDQIATAWAGLAGSTGEPPVIVFEPVTKKFTFYFPTDQWTGENANFKLSFSESLYFRYGAMTSFAYTEVVPPGDRVIFYQYKAFPNLTNTESINGTEYVKVTQDYSTLQAWNEFIRIRFSTDSMPVSSELDSSQRPILSRVITDFAIEADGGFEGQNLIFEPSSDLRFYALESNDPLRKIDINIQFLDRQNNAYPVVLSPNQSCQIKLLFRKVK